tara:strand:+ start:394 stop:519 length:126 start_codon:yes stop_codon:yes gene_type:complete
MQLVFDLLIFLLYPLLLIENKTLNSEEKNIEKTIPDAKLMF